jgi:hypothetical protein
MRLLAAPIFALGCMGSAQAQVVRSLAIEGAYVCVFDVDGTADTDWHTLTSANFEDAGAADGTACDASKRFVSVTWVNTSANAGRLKLVARTIAGDLTANRLIAPGNTFTTWPTRGVLNTVTRAPIAAIAYAKGNAADTGQIIVVLE